jgi:hypothetical protein
MGASLDVSGLPRLARPLCVLLVEDDASIREGLNKLVNTLGHRAHITQNVREALELAVSENEAFDLLLSDISLPDGDGWELACWRVDVNVNAKNAFGGYVGFQRYSFWFDRDRMIASQSPIVI